MKAAIPLALLLAACGQQADQPVGNEAAKPVLPSAKLAAPGVPAPRAFDIKNELVEFHFGWSAEAAAVPKLFARFTAEMNKAKTELLAAAKAEKAEHERQGFDFNSYSSSTDYKTAGQSRQLLSLMAEVAAYTGGAHGNYGTSGLLWDRLADKETKVADLFAAPENMNRLLTQPWCDALNKAREEKRGEPVRGGGMFDECPKLIEISIIPTSKDRNGKFERLMLIADPYVAGPYVEGSYEIDLPVTADLIAVLKSDYRDSFEVQPQ